MKEIEIGVTIDDVYLDVHGYYSPEEPMVMYYPDGSGHPGCSAEFEIISVSLNGTRITDLLSDDVYNEIIEKAIDNQLNQEQ
ncbi:MAG: hypothetical protein JHC33_11225 [Ignisphaera sp.]|nr:hypothetical protein [Ignisphaera sp.]